jgi:outer membrane biosynthesis protein TonB
MAALATLGDAPIAAIAVVAIALGLFFAARGPREKRATDGPGAGDGEGGAAGPVMVTLPAASAPEAEPGFVGPAGEIVGHGPIRLGVHGPLGADEAPAPAPAPELPPAPAPELPPTPEPAPVVPAAPEPEPQPQPIAEAPAVAAPPPEHVSPPAAEPSEHKDPAWRVAARAANSAVHFRQGTIKLGGKKAGKRRDH